MPGQLSERLVTPILAVELDDLTLERLRASVRGTELALLPVSRDDAVEHAALSAGPLVVLLEWLEGDEEEETRRFCEMLRRTCKRARCHILALGSLPDEAALLRAMAGPVDDVLSRPFGGDLALRLRRALRIAGSGRTLDHPRDALDEALASPTGGEVAVRSGDVTAFIHVQDGHVVWANVSSVPASMEEVVRHAGVQLDRDLIAAVKAECRASNKHFMDVLVTWSVVDEARAREAVRVFVAGRVEMALALSLRAVSVDGPTSARFDTGPPSQSRRPPLPLVEIAAVVQQAAAIEGAMGAAILDRNTGASLYHTGHEADSNVAWSQLTTLAALGPSAEDVMAADGERCFITRPLRFAPSLALFVALSLSATTLGLSRMTVARIAAHREGAAGEVVSRGREG
jgi:hypothetical protein